LERRPILPALRLASAAGASEVQAGSERWTGARTRACEERQGGNGRHPKPTP